MSKLKPLKKPRTRNGMTWHVSKASVNKDLRKASKLMRLAHLGKKVKDEEVKALKAYFEDSNRQRDVKGSVDGAKVALEENWISNNAVVAKAGTLWKPTYAMWKIFPEHKDSLFTLYKVCEGFETVGFTKAKATFLTNDGNLVDIPISMLEPAGMVQNGNVG